MSGIEKVLDRFKSEEELREYLRSGRQVWPPFSTIAGTEAEFFEVEGVIFMLYAECGTAGPFASLEDAIRSIGEPLSLAWLDGERVLSHEMKEPYDQRLTSKYVLRHDGHFWAFDPRAKWSRGLGGRLMPLRLPFLLSRYRRSTRLSPARFSTPMRS